MLEEVHGGVFVGFLQVFGEGLLGEFEVEVAVLMLALQGSLESHVALLDFIVDVLDVCAFLPQPTMGSIHLLAPVGAYLVLRSQEGGDPRDALALDQALRQFRGYLPEQSYICVEIVDFIVFYLHPQNIIKLMLEFSFALAKCMTIFCYLDSCFFKLGEE